jgi:hypothetical protein
VLEITNGDLSYHEAQEKYGIPKSTKTHPSPAGAAANASLRSWNLKPLLRNVEQILLLINKQVQPR